MKNQQMHCGFRLDSGAQVGPLKVTHKLIFCKEEWDQGRRTAGEGAELSGSSRSRAWGEEPTSVPAKPRGSCPCCPSGMKACPGRIRILRDLLPHSHPTSCSSSDAALLKVGSWERGWSALVGKPPGTGAGPTLGLREHTLVRSGPATHGMANLLSPRSHVSPGTQDDGSFQPTNGL